MAVTFFSIPASIPKNKIVQSSFGKLDPKKQLKEAGYPFNHIGTELTELQGKFEIVSKDVLLVKEEFSTKTKELSKKIDNETESLKEKISDTETNLLEKFKSLFSEHFLRIVGVLVGAIAIMYGGAMFLQESRMEQNAISFVAIIVGIAVLTIIYLITKNSN